VVTATERERERERKRVSKLVFSPFVDFLILCLSQEEERKAAELLKKNAVNLKTLNMENESKEDS